MWPKSKGMKFNLPQSHERSASLRGGQAHVLPARRHRTTFPARPATVRTGKRIRLQDLPNLTKNPGDGIGFAAWPAYRVSNGQMWGMQLRLNDCYRQQRFPYPGFGSDATMALSVYLGVNAKAPRRSHPPSSAEAAGVTCMIQNPWPHSPALALAVVLRHRALVCRAGQDDGELVKSSFRDQRHRQGRAGSPTKPTRPAAPPMWRQAAGQEAAKALRPPN
jgi:hypothetical protein